MRAGIEIRDAHFPGRAPIDAYGNGGFRFAEMSHRGSILALPSGIHGWDAASFEDIDLPRLQKVIADADEIEVLLVGCGPDLRVLPKALRDTLRTEHGIVTETMATGAAVRTFNVLLAEERAVAAALIAVEDPR
ncbi:MAG: Mth938-like domain-containing protein [Roseitalea porphyridii]|uniref:Mth938-like domain-containing protein n=1 Tax=Roseitalea porphyridii TaxID=1852022 RepID=UPI0032D98418